jgi:hypothetical protein
MVMVAKMIFMLGKDGLSQVANEGPRRICS